MSIERDALHTIKLARGVTAYVVHDNDAISPAESDGVAKIAYRTSEYRGKRDCPWEEKLVSFLSTGEAWDELIAEAKSGKHVAVAVDVRDHGSNGIHLHAHLDFDDCEAIFYCTPQKAREEWGTDADKLAGLLAEALTDECKEKAQKYMRGEIETWEQYFQGDVYGVVVHDKNGEVLDSCWGFYGYDYAKDECASMGKACVDHVAKEARKAAAKRKREAAERSYWACRGLVTA